MQFIFITLYKLNNNMHIIYFLKKFWRKYKWSLKEEMTCSAPQGSRVGPLVWNVMYDDFLRMDLPAGTRIVGFADDALVVCVADDVKILEPRINDSLWRAKRWLDSRCLKITCLTKLQEIARAKEAIRKDGRRRLVEKWQTRWHGDQSER